MSIKRLRLIDKDEIKSISELEAGMCRYPIGTPGTAGFGFCGKPAVDHGSYCQMHKDLCIQERMKID